MATPDSIRPVPDAALQHETVTDPIFIVASSATVGATFGGAAGGLQLARETGAEEDFERGEQAHQRMGQTLTESESGGARFEFRV